MIENSMLYRGRPKNKSDYEFLSKAYPENCKNGFVFGQPLIDKVKNRYYICVSLLATMNCTVANGTVTVIEVVPETINRSSTIMDSTGKFIFDGDIIKMLPDCSYNDSICEVYNYKGVSCVDYWTPEYDRTALAFLHDDLFTFEIIGNIYDNPDLIKGSDKYESI